MSRTGPNDRIYRSSWNRATGETTANLANLAANRRSRKDSRNKGENERNDGAGPQKVEEVKLFLQRTNVHV